jgi:hypothetical protein
MLTSGSETVSGGMNRMVSKIDVLSRNMPLGSGTVALSLQPLLLSLRIMAVLGGLHHQRTDLQRNFA